VYKTAASATQLANCILFHAYSPTAHVTSPYCTRVETKTSYTVTYLTSWYYRIFSLIKS